MNLSPVSKFWKVAYPKHVTAAEFNTLLALATHIENTYHLLKPNPSMLVRHTLSQSLSKAVHETLFTVLMKGGERRTLIKQLSNPINLQNRLEAKPAPYRRASVVAPKTRPTLRGRQPEYVNTPHFKPTDARTNTQRSMNELISRFNRHLWPTMLTLVTTVYDAAAKGQYFTRSSIDWSALGTHPNLDDFCYYTLNPRHQQSLMILLTQAIASTKNKQAFNLFQEMPAFMAYDGRLNHISIAMPIPEGGEWHINIKPDAVSVDSLYDRALSIREELGFSLWGQAWCTLRQEPQALYCLPLTLEPTLTIVNNSKDGIDAQGTARLVSVFNVRDSHGKLHPRRVRVSINHHGLPQAYLLAKKALLEATERYIPLMEAILKRPMETNIILTPERESEYLEQLGNYTIPAAPAAQKSGEIRGGRQRREDNVLSRPCP
ncbi:hypothetical protein AB6D11_18700 [Vibrio splendidus]